MIKRRNTLTLHTNNNVNQLIYTTHICTQHEKKTYYQSYSYIHYTYKCSEDLYQYTHYIKQKTLKIEKKKN